MSGSAHRLIARCDLPGYQPQNWCCVCGKATLKTQYVSCDEETCRNLCHSSCLGDTPVFKCSYTEQLRLQANILDPVSYISVEPDTPPLPLQDDSGKSQWESLEKVELISLVEKLTEEASKQNCIIKSLQKDQDLIIQHRDAFATALRVADRLIASKQRQAQVATRSQAVSALAETIDEHWESVCQQSESWRTWWRSGNPQQLRYTATVSPPTLKSPARESSHSDTAADPAPVLPVTPTATQSDKDSSVQTVATQRVYNSSTTTVNGVNRGASVRPRTSPQPTSGGDKRKKKSRRVAQEDTKREASEEQRTQQAAKQPRKQDRAKACDYCSRRGHTSATCYVRTDELRQERLIKRILTAERHTAAHYPPPATPQSTHPLTRLQSLSQPRPPLPQLGVWAQGQQQQLWGTPPAPHQYQQPAADYLQHLGLVGLTHYRPSPWFSQPVPAAN